MKQVIPFSKEIVFKTNIASITSISLEHEEKVYDGEVAGDFIIFGDYKVHNDTTEKELFKYRLPFTAILPEHTIISTVKVDIEDFTYDQIEDDVIKVNVDFSISYDIEDVPEVVPEVKEEPEEMDREVLDEIEEFLRPDEDNTSPEEVEDDKAKETMEVNDDKDITTTKEEYDKYHIHIVKENETLEQIIKLYETNMETVKMYNEVDKIKMGDKLIIPEYQDD